MYYDPIKYSMSNVWEHPEENIETLKVRQIGIILDKIPRRGKFESSANVESYVERKEGVYYFFKRRFVKVYIEILFIFIVNE